MEVISRTQWHCSICKIIGYITQNDWLDHLNCGGAE